MYKVLIVDDEQLIRAGMIARVQYLNFKFERIREAASGVEALALLEKEPADIVITDIKMPDMDGMTLIREAKEKYPGTQFVILSGYAEFEYAETAIELGVKSYLLKPISNDELKRVMRKLFETLEKERQMEVEIFRKHQLETEQKGWLQEKAVNHLWQDNAAFLTEEEAAQLKSTCPELWKKEKGSLYLVVINIDAKSYEGKKFRHEDIELIRFSVQNVFEEMRSGCWKLIVSNLANPNQLYAMFGRGKVSELRREIERMFLRIQVLFEEKMEIYLTFGVSRPTDFPNKTCVKEAGEALRQRMISGSSNLYFYEDLQVLQSVVFPSVELKMLSQYLERRDMENVYVLLEEILAEDRVQKSGIRYVRMIWIRILNLLLRSCSSLPERKETLTEVLKSFSLVDEAADIESLKKRYLALAEDCMKSGGMAQGNARSRILRAIEYLEAHYNEDIAINELAERYGMSPNYFSSLFKKEKQQSTVNYLIELRIRKAGDYLEHTEMSVADIARTVGYEDSQYFFRVFKKATGQTPLQYRQQHRKQE